MITTKRVREILWKGLASDSEILKGFASVMALPTALLAVNAPTPLAIGATLLAASGAGVQVLSKILERLDPAEPESKGFGTETIEFDSSYDRFKVTYFTLVQQSLLASLSECATLRVALSNCSSIPFDIERLRKITVEKSIEIEVAELRFHFTILPTGQQIELHEAYRKWLYSVLRAIGIDECDQLCSEVISDARTRFRVAIAAPTPLAIWMRNYLALASGDRGTAILQELSGISNALNGWKNHFSAATEFRPERWNEYREYLVGLPEQRETMYNEEFGVNKVFTAPRARYHRASLAGGADTAQDIPDVGRLIGALVSNRLDCTDLIVVCGGPGSGKSTLCRMVASELAKDTNMHPVFLRLRRQREGADVTSFIEESLISKDLITKLADLNHIPNLVLILDGFDELVLASKARLKTFFSSLLDAAGHGSLRRAKIIVSGRDTLFPNGAGLPRGSHVLSVQPFDDERVKKWGDRWREIFSTGPGSSFFPENLLDSSNKKGKTGPLHQLATWPLTLHLIAQLHTAGRMSVDASQIPNIEKAFLYRSILSITAQRQTEQADGRGRLDPDNMRRFLQAIAWEMYVRSSDTLDVEAVLPLARMIFKNQDEALHELTEVAVVNAPEIKRGEETGFEFVHKSFSEYLVAEHLALAVDTAAHQVEDIAGNLDWHQSPEDARRALIDLFGQRLLPAEVEEMLLPMLGCFRVFSRGNKVEDRPPIDDSINGLKRVIIRMQELYLNVLEGKVLVNCADLYNRNRIQLGPLEIMGNFAASVVLVGSSSADRIRSQHKKGSDANDLEFLLEPYDGAMWRWLFLVHAGGIQIDTLLANRLYRCVTVAQSDNRGQQCSDFNLPLSLGLLSKVRGYSNSLSMEIERARSESFAIMSRAALLLALSESGGGLDSKPTNKRQPERTMRSTPKLHFAEHLIEESDAVYTRMLRHLAEEGIISQKPRNRKIPGTSMRNAARRQDFREAVDKFSSSNKNNLSSIIDMLAGSLCRKDPDLFHNSGTNLLETFPDVKYIEALISHLTSSPRRSPYGRPKSDPTDNYNGPLEEIEIVESDASIESVKSVKSVKSKLKDNNIE